MSATTIEVFNQIRRKESVREGLITLRAELKKQEKDKIWLRRELQKGDNELVCLLGAEDAKIRKNAALILGELPCEEAEEALFDAYCKEEVLFVRPAYLEALLHLGSEAYVPELTEQLKRLEAEEVTEENKKHRSEERRLLRALITDAVGELTHTFTGYELPTEVILLTNRNYIELVKEQVREAISKDTKEDSLRCKEFSAGLRLIVPKLKSVLSVRTYEELLFVIPRLLSCQNDAKTAAKAVADSELLLFLDKRHQEQGQPYRFRIEYKSDQSPEYKSKMIRQMAAELEVLSGHKLVNSTGDYELELRMVENREGKLNLLLKLFTLKEERFAYRREAVAASIRPVNAALTCALTKDYLHEDAQILDPFCGVGTMLLERAKLHHVGSLYGIDSYGEAIEKARRNTEAAGLHVNYINRDFFDFKHEYLFDEIITDLPFLRKETADSVRKRELEQLYCRFFEKAREHLKEDGVIVLYSRNRELVRANARNYEYVVEQEFEISKREGSYVYVIHPNKGRVK